MAHFSRRVVAVVLGAFSLLALVPWSGATAGTVPTPRFYYVATNGHDSHPGTELQPFRTLRKGVSVLTPGATLYVKGGRYSEALINTIPGGQSWSQPVTVAAYPGHKVVMKPPRGSKFALFFQGAQHSYIIISGLTIDASNVTYEAVKITGSGTPATAAHHIRLTDTEIKNGTRAGLWTRNFAHSNEFIRLSVHDISAPRGHGIYLESDNNLVEECAIHDNADYGILTYKADGRVHGNVIRKNTITRNRGGSVVGRGSRHLFYNNLIYRNEAIGLRVDYAVDGARVLNNTIYGNGGWGIYIGAGSTDAAVVNNIIHAHGRNIGDHGRATTLSHNITVDPKVVDAGRFDFRPRHGSPAIDGGVKIALVTHDVAGAPRPQGLTHDVGAFEAATASAPAPKPAPTPTPALGTTLPLVPTPLQTPTPASLPQADIVPSSLKLGSATVKAGGTTPLQLTVVNRGTATAQSVAVTISLVSGATTSSLASGATTSRAASFNIGTLVAGASGTVATTLTAPMLTGTYTVLAAATTPDPETSTANNTTTTTLGVAGASTHTGTRCDYYASPNGTGSGESASAPFRIANFWDVARPGKTLCLLDGSYRGADSMIAPGADARGLSGTRDNPITVRALNDGAVTLDGQFALVPVHLRGNSWWVIQGINAKNSKTFVLDVGDGSNNTVVRRSVFWDAHIAKNVSVVGISGATYDVLLEDVAAFGVGRKVFSASQGPQRTVFRRVWGRWEGSITQGPKASVTMQYNTDGTTCENCLMTWSSESMPAAYTLTNTSGATLNSTPRSSIEQPAPLYTQDSPKPLCSHATILGSIGYVKAGDRWGGFPAMVMQGKYEQSCVTLKHTLMVMSPANSAFAATQGFLMNPVTTGSLTPGTSNVANNTTSIRGKADAWNTLPHSLHTEGTSLGAVANPWTTIGEGANLCYRWVNGAVTTTPLWPWPMNERIKAATAAAGAYGAGYPALAVGCGPEQGNCVGGRATRTETDVTADIEALLGPIAPHCKSH